MKATSDESSILDSVVGVEESQRPGAFGTNRHPRGQRWALAPGRSPLLNMLTAAAGRGRDGILPRLSPQGGSAVIIIHRGGSTPGIYIYPVSWPKRPWPKRPKASHTQQTVFGFFFLNKKSFYSVLITT